MHARDVAHFGHCPVESRPVCWGYAEHDMWQLASAGAPHGAVNMYYGWG